MHGRFIFLISSLILSTVAAPIESINRDTPSGNLLPRYVASGPELREGAGAIPTRRETGFDNELVSRGPPDTDFDDEPASQGRRDTSFDDQLASQEDPDMDFSDQLASHGRRSTDLQDELATHG